MTDYKYIVDTFAWIEYFRSSKSGLKARPLIEGGEAATPTVVIAELWRKLLRESEAGYETAEGAAEKLRFVQLKTEIVDLDMATAKQAAEINMEMRRKVKGWGLVDSIILATARLGEAKVVTGDNHFASAPEAIFLR
jgi:predicted nucleic acid-binding protein